MSERSEKLLSAMTDLDDSLVEEAAEQPKRKPWRLAALAAVLVLALGIGGVANLFMGGCGSGDGAFDGHVFMSYAGPVFPMTLREENDGISAERTVTLDFEPWIPRWQEDELFEEGGYYSASEHILVTDAYRLTNHSGEDRTVTLLYPFVANLKGLISEENRMVPELSLDGRTVSGTLRVGDYTGSYAPALGSRLDETLNLRDPSQWTDYQQLLEGGAYRENTLGPGPDLSGVSLAVYELAYPGVPSREDAENPTVRVEFRLEGENAQLMNCGFHGFSNHGDGSYTVLMDGEVPKTAYLMVAGGTLSQIKAACYPKGSFEGQEPMEGAPQAELRQYTADLETMLRKLIRQNRACSGLSGEEFELVYRAVAGTAKHCLLEQEMDRYDYGNLPFLISDAVSGDRVCYLESEVTIPAGSSVNAVVSVKKEASMNFGKIDKDMGRLKGYELTTKLDSNLNFTGQKARLEDRGQINIVEQNFGFDPEQGINEVKLTEPWYYLYVTRREGTFPEN